MDDNENRASDSDNNGGGDESIAEEETYQQQEQEQEQQKRRAAIISAMYVIPKKMDSIDGHILLDLVYTIRRQLGGDGDGLGLSEYWKRFVKFEGEDDDHHDGAKAAMIEFKIDSDGRITKLHIEFREHDDVRFDLPLIIERLKKLKDIQLYDCRSIPKELDNLPLLENLELHSLYEEPEVNMPGGIQLAGLNGLKSIESDSRYFLPLVTSRLNRLESLSLFGGSNEELKQVLSALKDDHCSFRQSLKVLSLTYCKMKEEDLADLLLNVLPQFPNLCKLDVSSNQIESLQMIESRIINMRSQQLAIPENCLQELKMVYNPVMEKTDIENIDNNPKEKKALLTILNTFNRISYLGGMERSHYDKDVEYILRIRHAGRKLITGGGRTANNIRPINRALWPRILERAHETSAEIYDNEFCFMKEKELRKCATGLFHLVLHGPLFAEIIVDVMATVR